MADMVENKISFNSKKDLQKFLNNGNFSFENIIPSPKTLKELKALKNGDRYILTKDDCIEPLEDREWFNWYKWNSENWGTKWDASNVQLTQKTITFYTAWCPPKQVFDKMAEDNYDMEFIVKSHEGGTGINKTFIKFKEQDCISEM